MRLNDLIDFIELERETWDKICEREGLNVDSLLAIRISGKNKFDFKGRCEQQMTYIKQMRACIRHLRDSEATAAVAMKDLEKNLEEKVGGGAFNSLSFKCVADICLTCDFISVFSFGNISSPLPTEQRKTFLHNVKRNF